MTASIDITLVSGSTTITLPMDMQWIDRAKRNLVAQNREITADGSQIIEEFQQMGGYPITLQTGADVWVTKSVVDALQALSDGPLASPMTLTYRDGTVISCRFSYSTGTPAVEGDPIWDAHPQEDTFPFTLTLRLIQASA